MTFQTPVGGSGNYFSEYFDLRTLLRYLHFIQVTNPFIIYSHLSFRHVEPSSMAGHMSHIQEPSIWPCSPRVSHSSVVRASNRYLEGHGFNPRWGLRKFFFGVFRLENASSLFTLYPSHQSIYHRDERWKYDAQELWGVLKLCVQVLPWLLDISSPSKLKLRKKRGNKIVKNLC